MAKDKTPDYTEFSKYAFGRFAADCLKSDETARYAPNALEILASSKGLNLGDEALGFIRGTQASEEGIKTAASVYGHKFEEKKSAYSPADLTEWYMPLLAGLEEDEKKKITGTLDFHKEKLKDIKTKYKIASKIIKDSEDVDFKEFYSSEQIEKAKKDIEKYKSVIVLMSVLDSYQLEGLRPDVIDSARKSDLKNLASKL